MCEAWFCGAGSCHCRKLNPKPTTLSAETKMSSAQPLNTKQLPRSCETERPLKKPEQVGSCKVWEDADGLVQVAAWPVGVFPLSGKPEKREAAFEKFQALASPRSRKSCPHWTSQT